MKTTREKHDLLMTTMRTNHEQMRGILKKHKTTKLWKLPKEQEALWQEMHRENHEIEIELRKMGAWL